MFQNQEFAMQWRIKGLNMKIKLFDQDNVVWEKEVDKEEFQHLKRICAPEQTNTSIWAQFLIPVRTHSLTYLALDFFSPIISNAIFYNCYPSNLSCAKQCEIIPVFFLELLTLPIRFTTLLPRVIYNAAQPEHPFRHWLYQEGVPEGYLMGDSVTIKLEGNPKIRNYDTYEYYDREQGKRIKEETPNYYQSVRQLRVNFFSPHLMFNVDAHKGRERVNAEEIRQSVSLESKP